MQDNNMEQVGSWPKYDKDLGLDGAKMTKGIRRQVLLGNFDAEPGSDEEMIKDYKASGLEIEKFLNTWKR